MHLALMLAAFALFGLLSPAGAAEKVWPGAKWATAKPEQAGMDPKLLNQGVSYAKKYGGAGMVVRGGRQVAAWGKQGTQFHLYSATKSFGSALLGLAIMEKRTTLDAAVQRTLPQLGLPPESNRSTGWLPLITVEHLATHTAGFDKAGGYEKLLFKPGSRWAYSDGGTNWLADHLTTLYAGDLQPVLQQRILGVIGVPAKAWKWRDNKYREKTLGGVKRREFGAGIYMNVDAMARFGLLFARHGAWNGKQVLPADYVARAGRPPALLAGLQPLDGKTYPNAPRHYGLLFWNNADGVIAGLPRDALWAWGLNEQVILAVPSLDLVISRAGPKIAKSGFGELKALEPFFGPIARSVNGVQQVAEPAPKPVDSKKQAKKKETKKAKDAKKAKAQKAKAKKA